MSADPKTTRRWSRRVVTLTAALAALAASVGVATATIPGSDGAISGCYNKTDGTLRVIDPAGQHCKATESPLTWNLSGPQGLPGPQGPQGPQGAPGPQGAQGSLATEIRSQAVDVVNNSASSFSVSCPTGKHAISAGYTTDSDQVQSVDMSPGLTGYWFYFTNKDLFFHHNATAYVTCAVAS
jgi:hypothetical protein